MTNRTNDADHLLTTQVGGDFATRFAAFADEARAIKAGADKRIMALLAEAQAILDELTDQGIRVRPELPMGANTVLTDMRLLASFQVRL